MIKEILEILSNDDYLGCHYTIEVAKGKYKIKTGFKEILKSERRKLAMSWRKRK